MNKKDKQDKQKAAPKQEPKEKKVHASRGNVKKIFVICTMVVLLVVAAYLNVLLSKRPASDTQLSTDSNVTTATVFSAMKSDRDTVRAQTYSYLDSIINSDSSSADAKSAAEAKKLTLLEYSGEEVVLENLIKARGFKDVCVTMTTSNVNVLVQDADLTAAEVAQILYVVTEETGVAATNVIIVPKS